MDFDLDTTQHGLLDRIDRLIEACGGHERALTVSAGGGYDGELDEALREAGLGADSSLLDRVLAVEHLAARGTATTIASRLAAEPGFELTRGGLSTSGSPRGGLVRYAGEAATIAVLGESDVHVVAARDAAPEPVPSGFGFPCARISTEGVTGVVCAGAAPAWRDRHRLLVSAEIAGNAVAALAATADHLRSREQFGRRLSTFQALRHRLAEATVSAEGTRWLVREAAYTRRSSDITRAAFHASRTAAEIVPELVQMGGARSFAKAFGLHVFTMRLEALRLELGGPDRLAGVLASQTAGALS